MDFNKVLIFVPHPDDGEFGVGGSMARWAAEGKEVILCVVTNGAHGSNDPEVKRDWLIETREQEQRAAAKITGISDVIFLGHEDGYLSDSHELRRDLIREIRRYKPDVVIAPDPTLHFVQQRYMNHPDHRALGLASMAAMNPGAATTPLYREDLYDQGFEPHKLPMGLLYFTDHADYFVDISEYIDIKVKAVMAHSSQFPEFSSDMPTRLREMSSATAKLSPEGFAFAEGFRAFYFQGPPGDATPPSEEPS